MAGSAWRETGQYSPATTGLDDWLGKIGEGPVSTEGFHVSIGIWSDNRFFDDQSVTVDFRNVLINADDFLGGPPLSVHSATELKIPRQRTSKLENSSTELLGRSWSGSFGLNRSLRRPSNTKNGRERGICGMRSCGKSIAGYFLLRLNSR